jgi:hypothetical protein
MNFSSLAIGVKCELSIFESESDCLYYGNIGLEKITVRLY